MSTGASLLTDPYFSGTPSANIPNLLGMLLAIGEDRQPVRLVKVMGRGTWSTVYKGVYVFDPSKVCAVKCMAVASMELHQRDLIANEVRLQKICAKATPHVLEIHDVFEENGLQFIVTDLCEKRTLLDYMNEDAFFGDDERVRNIFVQILDAVEACHEAGVCHRDLKPENIFFQDNGRKVILGDFGFASEDRVTNQFCIGTRPYMSPEGLGGFRTEVTKYSTRRADIWALGVIFMALIERRPPWSEASENAKDLRYPDGSVIDDSFLRYATYEPGYLYNEFMISEAAHNIFKGIFTLDPHLRVSIKDLREQIINADTFSRRNDVVKMVAAIPELESATLLAGVTLVVDEDVDVTDAPALDPVILADFPSPPEDLQVPTLVDDDAEVFDALNAIIARDVLSLVTESDITDNFVIIDSDSEFESESDNDDDDAESEGPITPETYAADNAAIAGAGLEEDIVEIDLGEMSSADYDLFADAEQARANVVGVDTGGKAEMIHAEQGVVLPPPLPKRNPLRPPGVSMRFGLDQCKMPLVISDEQVY